MKKLVKIFTCFVALVAIVSCGHKTYDVPSQYTQVKEQAPIFPDYRDIVVPQNIAPLNFMIEGAEGLVVVMEGNKGVNLEVSGEDRIDMDSTLWRQLLTSNQEIKVSVYANMQGWKRYAQHTITVAEEIDPFLSYRLIEPGYELYRQLGLYQRNMENFAEEVIYENNRTYENDHNHCVNCHNFQNYSTDHMLFHVRAKHGGTIMIDGDKATKIQIKDSTILTSGVYPSWHPTRNMVCFSTNKTGQVFHMYHQEKIEVIDEGSDLLLYDVDKNQVRHIIRNEDFQTFPCWNPAGDRIYYCEAKIPAAILALPDSTRGMAISNYYDSIRYDIKSITIDIESGNIGEPQMELPCSTFGKSASVPRISPDGRYMLYTLGDYGQFHIWHKSSDLWVKDLQNDSCYALKDANSEDVDSYHTWSSNGRWIVFSSRRMDGNYTRPFIAYFDKEGKAHKAFCLPQQDPEYNILLMKSYNVPELTRNAVKVKPGTLHHVIYESEGTPAKIVSGK